jgi:deoxycytidine triphosphate deaminase
VAFQVLCMVLSDGDILEAMEKGELGIEDFNEAGLTPNGYDLRVEMVLLPGSGAQTASGKAVIPPKWDQRARPAGQRPCRPAVA